MTDMMPRDPTEQGAEVAGCASVGQRRKPIWLGIVLILGGLALPIVFLTVWGLSMAGHIGKMSESHVLEADVPGEVDFKLERTGEYWIFYQHEGTVGGRTFSTEKQLPGLDGKLTFRDLGGTEVMLDRQLDSTQAEDEKKSRTPVWQFRAEQGAWYRLTLSYPAGAEGPGRIVLMVERDIGSAPLPWVAGMCITLPLVLLAGVAGVVFGIIILIAAASGLRENKRGQTFAPIE